MTRFASLTAGLLSRQGGAEPTASPFPDQLAMRVGSDGPDLRYHESSCSSETTARPSVGGSAFGRRNSGGASTLRHAELPPPDPAGNVLVEDEIPKAQGQSFRPAASEDPLKTFHVNLRLKRPRFVKLKLSAALLRRPAQDIVSEALDQWFEKLPPEVLGDCTCMKASGD